ncbi:MAG: phosphopentomutase, partial [bacterium]
MKAILLVLDSVGIGEAPDAADYGDSGANTLAHLSAAAGGLSVPTLAQMGLGNIPAMLPGGLPITGVPPETSPTACYGAMREVSVGKDTTTGHWEMAGLHLPRGFRLFPATPQSFPSELIREFERQTGRPVIGNIAASGTAIIQELGPRQIKEKCWIVYTSADSVFQIAAHEEVIPLESLYRACEVARALCNPYMVGRVIARPYIGEPGSFTRTGNRRDYSYPLPSETILDRLSGAGIAVTSVGKIDDIFAHRGITRTMHCENNAEAEQFLQELARERAEGLIFANLIDFDMQYGHRRDAIGYARALERADKTVAAILATISPGDMLIITADHGNDPTFRGTDHTREHVPLLVFTGNSHGT